MSYDDDLVLLYQPIVSLEDNIIVGFEALLRWQHPTEGLISPDKFIDIAEETGLIVPIGEWVLRTACKQMAIWRTLFGTDRPLAVNVNLSKRQLIQPDLAEMVSGVLEETGIKASDLKLEITETTVMDERHDMVPAMQRLRDIGIALAMDDFGTGYSSLGCLQKFPIQILKIDRSFVNNMAKNREFAAIVNAIIMLASHLDLDVVAEGIEDRGQLGQLQSIDCAYGQGYFFAKPLPVDEATAALGTSFGKAASA